MAEVNPPSFLENGCYTAQHDRLLFGTTICSPGVREAGGTGSDLRVGANTVSPRTVNIANGEAFVPGTAIDNQGMYYVNNDAHVQVTLGPPDPTDTRIDLIVARVYDGQYGGDPADSYWQLEAVTGTPSPAPIPPELPDNSLALAAVTIEPGATILQPSMIADLREPWVYCPDMSRNLMPGMDLNDLRWPGKFVAPTDSIAAGILNWPTPHGDKYSGLVEVLDKPGYGERIQRITEFARNNFVVWERHLTGAVGNEQWGPWFCVNGPGRWRKTGIYTIDTSNFTGDTSTGGSTVSGMNMCYGRVEISFRVNSVRDLVFESGGELPGNIADVTIGQIVNPNYRPGKDEHIQAVVPGRATCWVRVRSGGDITLTHGVPGSTITPSRNIDINGSWKVSADGLE